MPPIPASFKRFIAKQLSHPSGLFGKVVMGKWLNTMNDKHNRLVLHELDLSPHDHVLEVGFGGGGLLDLITGMIPHGLIEGIDISEEMVEKARRRFHAQIEAGRVQLHQGSAESLPYPDASIDKVCAVNTVYFWPDLLPIVQEFSRVIRPGGRLVLGFTPPEYLRRAGLDQFGFTPYSADELSAALTAHGFSAGTLHTETDLRGPCFALTAVRSADAPAIDAAVIKGLLSLEQQLNSPEVRHDRAILEDLIGDEFREFGGSGTVYTKQHVIEYLLASESLPITMEDASVKQLSETVFLITYKAVKNDTVSLRSSLWIRHDHGWKIVFHQGTNAAL